MAGAEARRRQDEKALRKARPVARAAMLALLAALAQDKIPPQRLARKADQARRAVGAVWEAAARLSEK